MTAREYFESVRETSQQRNKVLNRIRQRRELNGACGKGDGITGISCAINPDVMTFAVANLIEGERRDLAEIKELRETINEAMSVIRGINVQFGALPARLIFWHYVQLKSYSEAAKRCNIPKSTAFTLIRSTFAKCDVVGIGSLRTPEPRQPPEHRRPRTKHTPGAELRKHQVNAYKIAAF